MNRESAPRRRPLRRAVLRSAALCGLLLLVAAGRSPRRATTPEEPTSPGPPPAAPQTPTAAFPKGEIVDPVTTLADSEETYALYLPSNYTSERRRPVLLVFDPRSRGKAAADLFRAAAETYGWVVVSSNNTASDGRRRADGQRAAERGRAPLRLRPPAGLPGRFFGDGAVYLGGRPRPAPRGGGGDRRLGRLPAGGAAHRRPAVRRLRHRRHHRLQLPGGMQTVADKLEALGRPYRNEYSTAPTPGRRGNCAPRRWSGWSCRR